MKKIKVGIILSLLFTVILSGVISYSNNITTQRKNYLAASDDNVSTRELAMLASLVYENVPNDAAWGKNNGDANCKDLSEGKCFFTEKKDKDGKLLTKKRGSYSVPYYIEGMSARKANSMSNVLTDQFQEDGQKYYFLNFADVKELEGRWSIFDYKSDTDDKDPDDITWNSSFDTITFKKGNNYVISFRGTDYPDLYEWVTNLLYSINGENSQSMKAYNYAQSVYDKILKDNSNAKIYVTGHSLGGYLAQIAGAAIVDKEAGITDNPEKREIKGYKEIGEYKEIYSKTESHLEQVAYFNGMGVSPMLTSNNFTTNVNNALIYLSAYNKDGELSTGVRKVNYSDNIASSGRLVLYSIDGDPVSELGLHYGEIFKLEYGADAVTNHENHTLATLEDSVKKDIENVTSSSNLTDKDIAEIVNNLNTKKLNAKKLPETLSKVISTVIDIKNVVSNSLENQSGQIVPEFLKEQNKEFENYLPLTNLGNVISNYASYISEKNSSSFIKALFNNPAYKYFGIFEYANVNHETDSFMCIMDSDNGIINSNDIELTVTPVNMDCDGKVCNYSGENYVDNYIVNDDLSKYKDKEYIKLSANVKKGCVKSYAWYFRTDKEKYYQGITFNDSKSNTTFKNEIIIPKDKLEEKLSESNKVYFMVSVYYGDTYSERKLEISHDNVSNKNKIEYTKVKDYKENPTLTDNSSEITFPKDSNRTYGTGPVDVYGNERYYYYTNAGKDNENNAITFNK